MTEKEQKRLLIEVRMIRAMIMIILQVLLFNWMVKDYGRAMEMYGNFAELNRNFELKVKELENAHR